jgi:hypothetical protein
MTEQQRVTSSYSQTNNSQALMFQRLSGILKMKRHAFLWFDSNATFSTFAIGAAPYWVDEC